MDPYILAVFLPGGKLLDANRFRFGKIAGAELLDVLRFDNRRVFTLAGASDDIDALARPQSVLRGLGVGEIKINPAGIILDKAKKLFLVKKGDETANVDRVMAGGLFRRKVADLRGRRQDRQWTRSRRIGGKQPKDRQPATNQYDGATFWL
jgi:hypothetical protein